MKKSLILIVLLVVCVIGCKPIEPIELDYCEMLKRDQSYVDRDEPDEKVRTENNRKRGEIFIENFEALISLTKQDGFPEKGLLKTPLDSCRIWAINMTLIHMVQEKPETFFSQEIVSLFDGELKKGNLEAEDLASPIRTSFMTNRFCSDLRDPIQKAIDVWGVGSKIFREPKFKECD